MLIRAVDLGKTEYESCWKLQRELFDLRLADAIPDTLLLTEHQPVYTIGRSGDPNLIARISVFDRNGRFLRSFGKAGTGPGEFRTPHALAFDSHGNLVIADRHNHRVQLMTKRGEFVREYTNFSRVSGLVVDANDILYATDSESTEAVHPGWSRGLRIGSLADGRVTMFVPPHKTNSPEGAMGEGIALDPRGNIYLAESIVLGVTKLVKEPTP